MEKKSAHSQVLGVEIHGVRLNLHCNEPALLEYARAHLGILAGKATKKPDIEVECIWKTGAWDPTDNPFPSNGELNVIGKRMQGDADQLVWLNTVRKKGLQLRFTRRQGQFLFQVAYTFDPKKKKGVDARDYRYKKFFSLMSYLVYYPISWYLESTRGWAVVHASALQAEQGAVLIAGLGGVGKTTTCVALMKEAGMALLSENLVYTDGVKVYPCIEPIRLDENSLTLMGKGQQLLKPVKFPEGLKKKWLFHPRKPLPDAALEPQLILFPYFTSQPTVRPLEAEIAAEKVLASNRLTREIDDYDWYKSALRLHWPQPMISALMVEVVNTFVRQARCFELGIDRTSGIKPVVRTICELYQQCLSS